MQRYGPDAPDTPRLAVSLRHLMRQVDTLWPDRGRASDGWIGDLAHQSRESDHNPDHRGIVHAVDITAADVIPEVVLVAACVHPSTRYVIFQRIIYRRAEHFHGQRYSGRDRHTSHLHISILNTREAEQSHRMWLAESL